MEDWANTRRRHALGTTALGLLGGGAIIAISWSTPSAANSASGSMIKIGLVLGALWLAWPQIDRFLAKTPAWLMVTSLVCLVLIVMKPLLALLLLPCLALLWLFGPRLASQADQFVKAGRKRKRS